MGKFYLEKQLALMKILLKLVKYFSLIFPTVNNVIFIDNLYFLYILG